MPARPDSPARALAWLYTPATQRAPFALLCALEREIGAGVAPGRSHEVAHARLSWWRDECARSAAGQPLHPLTRELWQCAGAAPLVSGLAGLIDTAVWDLAGATCETQRELTAYCQRWSAAMIEPLAQLAAPSAAPAILRGLGTALRELELLLALAGDARAGRLHLPLDALDAAQVAPEQLAQPPWPASLAELLRRRHRQLRALLAGQSSLLLPAQRRCLRGFLVWAALVVAASQRAEALLPQAPAQPARPHFLDGWRAWQVARRASAGT
jgi:phytoene synthase